MNISPANLCFKAPSIERKDRLLYNNLSPLQNDTVCFCGKEKLSDRENKALNFGKELLEINEKGFLNTKKIQRVARTYNQKIKVKNIAELKSFFGEETARWHAYLLPSYNEKTGDLDSATLYLPDNIEDDGVKYIGHAVHEFTHALQRSEDDSYMGIYDYVGRDVLKARAVNTIASNTFYDIEGALKAEIAAKIAKTGFDKENPDKEDIYKLCECNDKDEFDKIVRKGFIKIYSRTIDSLDNIKKGSMEAKIINELPLKNDPRGFRSFIKAQCKKRSEQEKEAYSAQKEFLKSQNSATINDLTYPVLYEALIEALS